MKTGFPERLTNLEAARDPFRQALHEALGAADDGDLLIYTPADENAQANTPAGVLAVTSTGWLWIEETVSGGTATTAVDFAQTLWVELTGLLLYGSLTIAYAEGANLHRRTIVFSTTRIGYYGEAAERIVRGTRGLSGDTGRHTRQSAPGIEKLSFKFRSALYDVTPPGESVQVLINWPMVAGSAGFWSKCELANAGFMVLTEHTLLVVREELSEGHFWLKRNPHYGKITAFVPLQRLCGYTLCDAGNPSLIRISLHLADGTVEDELNVNLPSSLEADAQVFLERLTNVVQVSGTRPWAVADRRASLEAGAAA